ncbi:ECF RNA polymerase sigma factor SigE [bacterium BMS3Bbin01]|nr:ECF RNA polymerase sigma factor SigE [bacterium BMS3Bbin01]
MIEDSFPVFVARVEPMLRRGLVARFGATTGRDACVDVLSWVWPRWDRIRTMTNPVGYLYRVAVNQTRRRLRRRSVLFPPVPHVVDVWVEPGLPAALSHLTTRQREAVVLVYGYGMSHTEAAALLGMKRSTIQNHVERGLGKLRTELGVHHHA